MQGSSALPSTASHPARTHRDGRALVGAEPGVGAVIPRVLAMALPAGKGPPSVQQEALLQRFLELKETGMPLW